MFLRAAKDWLVEVRYWDALWLVWMGRTETELESALGIQGHSGFWEAFHGYHGCTARQLLAAYRRRQTKHERQLDRIFGSIPEPLLVPAPWELALHKLTPHGLSRAVIHDPAYIPDPEFFAHCLHERICQGRPAAREVLVGLLSDLLIRRLQNKWPCSDEQVIADGVTKALIDYLEHPRNFDPERGVTLGSFFHQAAWRKVSDLNRAQGRRGKWHEAAKTDFLGSFENSSAVSPSPTDLLIDEENEAEQVSLSEMRRRWLDEASQSLPFQDQQILQLMRDGADTFNPYAAILGITALPESEQRKKVNAAKQRIYERLVRRRKNMSRQRPEHSCEAPPQTDET